jgi:hypothetical protein
VGSRCERPGNDHAGVGLSMGAKEARGTQSVGVGAIITNYKIPRQIEGLEGVGTQGRKVWMLEEENQGSPRQGTILFAMVRRKCASAAPSVTALVIPASSRNPLRHQRYVKHGESAEVDIFIHGLLYTRRFGYYSILNLPCNSLSLSSQHQLLARSTLLA